MPNRMPPDRGYDLSYHQLGRTEMHGSLRDFLRSYATRDRVVFYDDFTGDAINLDNYALAQSQTSVTHVAAAVLNGVIQGTVVATTTASLSIVTPAIWSGNNNASFEARFKVNTVASTFILEAGFIDAVPGSSGPGIADIDTATGATMTSGALFHFNNAATHTGAAFGTIGDFTGQTFATTLLTTGFTTPVADTYMTVKVQLLTNPGETSKTKAHLWINGKLRASHAPAAGAVDGAQLLAGWIYIQAVAAAAKIHYVDYIRIEQYRAALGAALE
jgi:hypothetical protein